MYSNCLECSCHAVIPDPDPTDWFCDDDVAIVCQMTPNKKQDEMSKWISARSKYRAITVSCRPHHLAKEAKTPSWCPLNEMETENA